MVQVIIIHACAVTASCLSSSGFDLSAAHFMSPGLMKFLPHTVYYTGSVYSYYPWIILHHIIFPPAPVHCQPSSTHHPSTTILIPCFFPHWLPLLLKTLVWRALSLSLLIHVHLPHVWCTLYYGAHHISLCTTLSSCLSVYCCTLPSPVHHHTIYHLPLLFTMSQMCLFG